MFSVQQKRFNALQKEMRTCKACLLAGFFVQPPAVTKGSFGAKIITIGQAPGITEVEAGRPFNAGSGKRLFQWLGAAGIDEGWFRTTQYMTAVTKCFPGKVKNGSGDRVPSHKERELCRPFLDAEIDLINPLLIIPIGRLAIERYFGTEFSLEELIGKEKRVDGCWVIPLPHPSGASRWHQMPKNRKRIEKAIKLIARRYKQLFPTKSV